MTTGILITLCALLLAAYVFDFSSARTRIPSVILLLVLGWGMRQVTDAFELNLPDLSPILPLFGTIGLIMIVLEGALELDLDRSKLPLLRKAAWMALGPLVLVGAGLALAVTYWVEVPFVIALTNALPLAVISSAIAIPTAHGFGRADREFVIFESSLSDIIGVLLFNFVALNHEFGWMTFGTFGLNLVAILVISFVATLGLAFLLSRIQHHVKFAPIILLVVLIYGISKVYHLPGLILILAFGMFLANLEQLRRFKWIDRLRPDSLEGEVTRMKELILEGTFLVRSLFFLLFGYQIETSTLLDGDAFIWALGICVGIFLVRAIFLKLLRMHMRPLLFIAPRGLVTVLLFLSIPHERSLTLFGRPLIIQVVLLSALVMMVGTIFGKPNGPADEPTA